MRIFAAPVTARCRPCAVAADNALLSIARRDSASRVLGVWPLGFCAGDHSSPELRWPTNAGRIDALVGQRARGRRSGSSPWSNSRLDLVQMLAPVAGPHRVERARIIKPREQRIRERGD